MKGYIVREFGSVENMLWETLPDPVPGPEDILIAVRASGINFAETRMRAGNYTGQPLPFVMGMEAAGDVLAVGSQVEEFQVGQRIFGRARGAHAEKVLMHKDHAMALPDKLSYVEGAGIPVGWLTAWHALHTVAKIQRGERVLIEAVASSVGSAALQIAKASDAWVAGTASRDDKLVYAKESGCDLVVNYKTEDLAAKIQDATNGLGCDIGMMTIGRETVDGLMDSMGMSGRVTLYGSTSGKDILLSLLIGMKNLKLLSMSISTCPDFVPVTMKRFREVALPLFDQGVFKPVIAKTLPLTSLSEAHRMIDERAHYGKIIMEVTG